MIEAAKAAGQCLADDYLAALETSRRAKDQDRLADILIVLESYAHRGKLEVPRELNRLTEDIQELKAGDARLPFFDVINSDAGAVRLTHGFNKKQQRTPRREIDRAKWVKREDTAS
ncbi:type II toxin-antitoxin system RelE/ParE family toxin [Streptomyces sp. NRRL S-1824]|uniref:type II toxin-antitoxin system RelE/ParE family toxin n=1 Tax=Streptomyces sp. NRRL S-1824 TaxID=1463889 RepID=UPI00099B26E5|nr:type II toxin-antitoxin system RelE/ParE family toxin [Streptomyces sp. NRRL S-1824]